MRTKDENYILDLCDEILNSISQRQYKFDFLLGDPGKNGTCRKLPVDAYYSDFKLVIEYRELQHTEAINHFDKPNKITVSRVPRRLQRAIYDNRRREVIPRHNIKLIEISYSDFDHNSSKRLKRNIEEDKRKLKILLRRVPQTAFKKPYANVASHCSNQ